jgi:hypothetical protein
VGAAEQSGKVKGGRVVEGIEQSDGVSVYSVTWRDNQPRRRSRGSDSWTARDQGSHAVTFGRPVLNAHHPFP